MIEAVVQRDHGGGSCAERQVEVSNDRLGDNLVGDDWCFETLLVAPLALVVRVFPNGRCALAKTHAHRGQAVANVGLSSKSRAK